MIRDFVYDYPFLFVFLLLLGLYISLMGYVLLGILLCVVWVVLLAVFNWKSLPFALILLTVALISFKPIYVSHRGIAGSFSGVILKVHRGKRIAFEIRGEKNSFYAVASSLYDNVKLYDRVRFKGRFKPVVLVKNSRFKNYLISRGISYYGYVAHVEILPSHSFLRFVEGVRLKLEKEFYYFLPRRDFVFVASSILGDTSEKSSIRAPFVNTQTAHIMAVSGLHMGFVFGVFYLLFYLFAGSVAWFYERYDVRVVASAFAIVPVSVYFVLSGMSIPSLRAFLFVLIFIFSLVMGAERVAYNVLFLVACGFVAFSGFSVLYSASFVLSFVMSFSAIFLSSMVFSLRVGKLLKYALFIFLMSVFSVPLSMYYFGRVSLFSPLANGVVVPYFGFVIVPYTFLTMLFSLSGVYWIERAVFGVLHLVLYPVFYTVDTLSRVGGLNVRVGLPVVVLCYVIMFGAVYLFSVTRTGSR